MMSGEVCRFGSENIGNGHGENRVEPEIVISDSLYSELIRTCLEALPQKAYGLVGGSDRRHPKSLYPCSTNLRNTPEWKAVFDSFGDFHRNPDLGFVIAPSEVKAVTDRMASRHERLVGVYHSHRFLKAEPSVADIALGAGAETFSYIVSVANPPSVEVGIFSIDVSGYHAVRIIRS
jgi:proteasome lid subunit RPN8/RPN11